MLILTRRSNERIFIGDDVVLVVLGIENNRVKLGIEAPSEIAILREEIVGDAKKGKNDLIAAPTEAVPELLNKKAS